MSLAMGTRLGPYDIVSPLGAGGMGEVYKAYDARLHRFVAIKILPSQYVSDPDRKRRLTREAQASSALNHPNIVTIHDISAGNGHDYIVMEYVPGKTLDELIPRSGMPFPELLKIAIQIAGGLTAAHAAGIIHRDLKPSNIIVSESGLVKILDFGLAKVAEPVGTAAPETTLTLKPETQAGMIMGTTLYMSPEQAKGEPLDARSDIFSFGSVLYEMTTGRKAFLADSQAAIVAAILKDEPKPLAPSAPSEFEQIVMRCLRKDPGKRQQHMSDVKVLLEELQHRESPPGSRPSRPWLLATGMVVLALVIAIGAGVWLSRGRPEQPQRVVPLTTSAGNETFPAFSPDGNQVAFCWDGEKQDRRDLYVKMIGDPTPLKLTTDGSLNSFPSWSRDGRQIAFVKGGPRAGIYLISPLGAGEQKIADLSSAGAPAWSPDGKFLVVAKPRIELAREADEGALFLVPVQSGQPHMLLAPEKGRSYQFPAIARDGHTLAIASCGVGGPACAIFLIALGKDLLPHSAPRAIAALGAQIGGLAWTADGRSLVYGAGTSINDNLLWRIDLSGGPPKRIEIGTQGAMFPAVAWKGNRLAFTRFNSDPDIWRLELGGKAQPFLASTMLDMSAQLSPDGRRIAFSSSRGIDRVSIWVADANGANLIQLTRGPGTYDGSPRWSPDGRWIAFDALGEHGLRNLKVVESSGGQPSQLIAGSFSSRLPSWSRDGQWIYFSSDRTGQNQIWRMPAKGGAAGQVTSEGGYLALEAPDGKTLYYTKTGDYANQPLYARPLAGGAERKVLEDVAGRGFQIFENGMYYLSATGERTAEIRFYDFAGSRSRTISEIEAPLGLGLAVSPDRRTFLFSKFVAAGLDLMLIENFH